MVLDPLEPRVLLSAHSPVMNADLSQPGEVDATTAPSILSEATAESIAIVSTPLAFEANRGQTNDTVDFVARGDGYTILLSDADAIIALDEHIVRLDLVGGDIPSAGDGDERLPGVSNYLIGNDPEGWITGVENYRAVQYDDVYPGIDVRYYGNQRRFEYDFVVGAGADPGTIAIGMDGARSVEIDDSGDLLVAIGDDVDAIRFRAPFSYQRGASGRETVESRYVLADDGSFGFELGDYDPTRPLVIDPVLDYATYLGGTGADRAYDVAVGADGSVFVTGSTSSIDFPGFTKSTTDSDVFVTKLTAGGAYMAYSTYFGGTDTDSGRGIAVDASGQPHVVGSTSSTDFPTVDAYDTTHNGGTDAFAARLSADGSSIDYSSYYGGSSSDGVVFSGIALDSAGAIHLSGQTASSDLPTVGAFDSTLTGARDLYAAKIDPSISGGGSLVYATYAGGTDGSGFDQATGITVDGNGNIYLTGSTTASDSPTTAGAYQQTWDGSNLTSDGMIFKLDPDTAGAGGLLYGTYFHGTGSSSESVDAIAVDDSGVMHVFGDTFANDLPTTPGAYASSHAGGTFDTWVGRLNPAGGGAGDLLYLSYLGGSGDETPYDVAVDPAGRIIVSGRTTSGNYPTVSATQGTYGGNGDAIISVLNPAGAGAADLEFSTYLGGGDSEIAYAIALGGDGSIYVTGTTDSTDFPATVGTFDTDANGDADSFIARIAGAATPTMNMVTGTYDGDAADGRGITGLGFQPDFVIIKGASALYETVARTSAMPGDATKQLVGGVALFANGIESLDADGFTLGSDSRVNANGETYYWTAFKAGPGEMVVDTYSGAPGDDRNIVGLGLQPDYMIIMGGGTQESVQRFQGQVGDASFELGAAGEPADLIQSFNADGFQVGTDARVNQSGQEYYYVAWKEIAGSTDFGTYTGNDGDGRAINDPGFEADYVLVRHALGADTVHRPASLTGDNTLSIDNSAAYANGIQQFLPAGFEVGDDITVNVASETYHYAAFDATAILAPHAQPVITLPGGTLSYIEGDGAVVIDGAATVTDPDSLDFDGGVLTVDFTSNGSTDDRLTIRDQGTGSGEIGVSGSNVSYEGTQIATFAGGTDGATPLVVTLDADADQAAGRALVRSIEFTNLTAAPVATAKGLRFVMTDGDGGNSGPITTTIDLAPSVEFLRPESPGDATGIDSQTPGSGAHWDKVDDTSADNLATSVNTASTSYQQDLYGLTDSGVGTGTIDSVTVYVEVASVPDATVYAIAYESTTDVGIVKTVSVAGDGQINAEIDSLWFDAVEATTPVIARVSDTIYAIAYAGDRADGFLQTVEIAANGQITDPVVDTLEFDTFDGATPSLLHVSGDFYAIVYMGKNGDGFLKTVEITSAGAITNSVVDTLEFDTNTTVTPDITHVSGDIYAVAYSGVDADGYLRTVEIATNGLITDSTVDTLEFDTSTGEAPSIIHVSGDVYVIAYQGLFQDGDLATVQIAANGQITNTVVDRAEFDGAAILDPEIVKVSDTVFAIAYTGTSGHGYLRTMAIAADGDITDAALDTLVFDATNGSTPRIIAMSGDLYAISYEGADSDGFLKTVSIASNGQIDDTVIDSHEFDVANGLTPSTVAVSQAPGTTYARPVIKTGGTVYTGAESSTSNAAFTTYSHEWTTNPDTAAPWTWSDIDALQAGLDLRTDSAGYGALTTQVYVAVDYVNMAACADSDGDGLCDLEEDANTDLDNDPSTNPGPNTDGDGLVNYLDADDDGDGTATASEDADPNGDGDPRDALDSDRDGQPDYLDDPTGASDGTVDGEQKISNTAGGLSAVLDDDDQFGRSIAPLGDLDGDGVVDIAVGAHDDDGGSNRGALHILFLNADGTVKSEQKISSTTGGLTAALDDGDWFGRSVTGLGDLDGDGIHDLAVGAIRDDDGGTNRGAVHILFLNADGTVRAEQKISDTAGGFTATLDDEDQLGEAVAGLGDLDGDGIPDLAVGAHFDDDGGTDRGAVYRLAPQRRRHGEGGAEDQRSGRRAYRHA